MASLESLPADQRAVLQLVLQRGRSYDQIARLLSMDRTAVRQRAIGALASLGPDTGLPGDRRELITDYLLGQLEPEAADAVRDGIGGSPADRAWARVVASELGPLAASSASSDPQRADRVPVRAGRGPASARPPNPSPRRPRPRRCPCPRRRPPVAPPPAAAPAPVAGAPEPEPHRLPHGRGKRQRSPVPGP